MRKGMCRHYNGAHQHARCEAGVEYDSVTPRPNDPGKYWRVPCFSEEGGGEKGTCEKYDEPNEEELSRYEAEMKEAEDRIRRLMPLVNSIKTSQKGKDWSGIVRCPICGNDLEVKHSAYNGHVSGHCNTDGCVSWIE